MQCQQGSRSSPNKGHMHAFAQVNRHILTIKESAGLSNVGNATALPQHYHVTYSFTEANFMGNDSLAELRYSADSAMQLKVLHRTNVLVFNSVDLQYTAIQYTVDGWLSVCLCGMHYKCLTQSCDAVLQPLRYHFAALKQTCSALSQGTASMLCNSKYHLPLNLCTHIHTNVT